MQTHKKEKNMKYSLLILASTFFLLQTYLSAPDEFSEYDKIFIGFIFVFIIFIQIIFTKKLKITENIKCFLLSLFSVINIFSVHILLSEELLSYGLKLIILFSFIMIFILYTLNKIIFNNKYASIISFGALNFLILYFIYSIYHATIQNVPEFSVKKTGTASENVRLLTFNSKPNIYFISFDSLIPKSLMQMNMKLGKTEYHEKLDQNFNVFKNAFSNAVPTKRSLNSLLALDPDYFTSTKENFQNLSLFQGLAPSPLLQIMKHNGYSTNTLYNTRYFGKYKGPHVDNYWINQPFFTACEFVDNDFQRLAMLGYCHLSDTNWFKKLAKKIGATRKSNPMRFLLKSIKKNLETNQPQFWLGYIFSPGHTNGSYRFGVKKDFQKFQKTYIKNSKKTALHLQKLLNFLKKNDPNALLFVFGDHGPRLSRGMNPYKNPKFYIRDRYGVFAGTYPKEKCKDWYSELDKIEYSTPIQIAELTIKCLSGESPFIITPNFKPLVYKREFKPFSDLGSDIKFNKLTYNMFLYE